MARAALTSSTCTRALAEHLLAHHARVLPSPTVAASTRITLKSPGPVTEITTTASAMNGKARWMSVMRNMALSIGPPQKPDRRPQGSSGEKGDCGGGNANEQRYPSAVDEAA